jgi:hypothetical protein
MISNSNINFKKLSQKGYQNSDINRIIEISDDIENNSKDFNLLVNGYGDGKSTTVESMLDVGDTFAMGNYDQVMEKMLDCKTDHQILGIQKKYQLLVGQLKWLGYKWVKENGESKIVKDEDRVYQNIDPWVYDRDAEKLKKFDLERERRKPYVQSIIDDIEEYGRKNALDYHKDKPIVEAYGQHLHPETRKQTVCFTPIDMIDLVKELNQTGDLIVDEGIGGEVTEVDNMIGILGNYADTIQKITGRQVNSRTSKPKCDIPNIDNDKLKIDIVDLWEKVREIYIDIYDELEEKELVRKEDNLVYCDIYDLIDRKKVQNMRVLLEQVRKENSKGVPRVKEEKIASNDMDKIVRINNLLKYADFISKSSLSPAKIEAYRDKHNSVKRVCSSYPKYYDLIKYSDKAYNVYVLNASADRDLPQLYVERSDYFSPEIKILGEEAGIETIEESELVTKHFQFGYGRNETISKGNLRSQKFDNVIVPMIDWFKGDNFVTSVKNDYNGNSVPDKFDTESVNYAKIEGSNKARDCDNLFVIGSNRMNKDNIWISVKDRYQEIIEFTEKEWRKLVKVEENWDKGQKIYGSQIGWKDPEEVLDDFEWEGDYDFNPLQKIWSQDVDRNKFEKMNRKRYQDKERDENNPDKPHGEGCVINLGIRPVIGGEKFGRSRGKEGDLVKWIIEENDGTPLEKAKWIKENIDSHYTFVEMSLPDNIPLKTVYKEGDSFKWKIDYKGIIEDQLQKESWEKNPETGEESREEVELYETVEELLGAEIEELPFSKKTLKNWIKDSIYLDYTPGTGRHVPPMVKASEISQSPWNNYREPPV